MRTHLHPFPSSRNSHYLPQEDEGKQVLRGEELAELVRHLKLKWQSLNEAYVRLPCVLDTPSKRRRKEVSWWSWPSLVVPCEGGGWGNQQEWSQVDERTATERCC